MKKVWYLLLAVCLVACENTPEIEKALEVEPQVEFDYADLGLKSGTKWKKGNEIANEKGKNSEVEYFTFNQAIKYYYGNVPTKAQWDELIYNCQWTWDAEKKGYDIVGPNGGAIFLPARGTVYRKEGVTDVGVDGSYWTSTANESYPDEEAWCVLWTPYTNGAALVSMEQRSKASLRLVWK